MISVSRPLTGTRPSARATTRLATRSWTLSLMQIDVPNRRTADRPRRVSALLIDNRPLTMQIPPKLGLSPARSGRLPRGDGRVEDKRLGDPPVGCRIDVKGPVTAPGADGRRPTRPDSPANAVGIFTMLDAYHGEVTCAPIMNYRNRVVAAPAKGARQAPHKVQPAAL